VEIEHLTILGERLKAMGKTFRDQKTLPVPGGEDFCMPAKERWGSRADINRHIEYLTLQAGDYFALPMGWILEMKAPDGPFAPGEGMVDLCNRSAESGATEFLSAEEPAEKTTVVGNRLSADDPQAIERGGKKVESLLHTRCVHRVLMQSS
jgi:hypothetical protein